MKISFIPPLEVTFVLRHGGFFLLFDYLLALGRGLRGNDGCLTLSCTIALALVASALLAVIAGAVTLGGLPATPGTGSLLAVGGAIARLGTGRGEPTFAALEQTDAAALQTPAAAQESLTRRVGWGIV